MRKLLLAPVFPLLTAVLHEGRVCEYDTPDNLLAQPGSGECGQWVQPWMDEQLSLQYAACPLQAPGSASMRCLLTSAASYV